MPIFESGLQAESPTEKRNKFLQLSYVTMIAVPISFFLVGILVGQRFRALILFPLTIAALLLTLVISLAFFEPLQAIVIIVIASVIGVQVGYVIGAGVRQVFAARERRVRTAAQELDQMR